MLELHAPEEAFLRLERYLADEGFFGGPPERVADLYLGYALSEPLRRTAAAAPPEPCPLPLLACRIRGETPAREPAGYELGAWERSWTPTGYVAAIRSVQEAIARGDVY